MAVRVVLVRAAAAETEIDDLIRGYFTNTERSAHF